MNNLRSKSAVSSQQSAGQSRLFFLPTAICQLLTISLFLLTANCLLPTSSHAIGTTAGINITNASLAVTLNFSNVTNAGTVTRNSSNTISNPVEAVYGLIPVLSNQNLSTQAGVSTNPNFVYTVTNNSNTAVTINASSSEFIYSGSYGTGGWSKSFADSLAENISNGMAFVFSFEVRPTTDAYFGSTASTTLNFYLDPVIPANRTGAYTGFNSISYGGSTTLSVLTTTTVAGPDVQMISRTMQVIAPASYVSNGGASNANVPGSRIDFRYVFKNLGDAAAATLNVKDAIPPDTEYYSTTPHTATMAFNPVYYFKNSTSGNTLPGFSPVVSSINAVEWVINNLNGQSTVTLNYSVVVR